ncbi:hypothetical protein BBJ28_00016422 [Nothophytophthora sp. Chile5]|nr:hypothetical protein BBJ28_00016422 [Nothophytophthora sp. Chile5]
MGATNWTTEDLLWLVQAWSGAPQPPHFGEKQDVNATSAFGADPGIYNRFLALSGGSTKRSAATVRKRTEVVLDSHAFIRAFHADREWSEGRDWFSLSVGEQRARMRTAGSRQVQLIDTKVFAAVDAFFDKKDTSPAAVAPKMAAVAPKASIEDEESEEEESDASDLKEEKAISSDGGKDEGDSEERRQKPYPKFRGSWISREETSKRSSDSESESEEESQPPAEEEEEEEEKERVATKRRRVSSDDELERILAKQSRSLVNFLSERASERSRERELSRQEREVDRRFWTEERAKDRALLRELFARRGRR